MGLLDLISAAAAVVDAASGKNTYFVVKCNTLEIFEIGTQWKGTARIHGAGEHIETLKANHNTVISMPDEDSHRYTRRGELRRQLREWASKTFTKGLELPKEFLVLNDGENCLSFEGYAKKIGEDYRVTLTSNGAQYYVSYKLEIYRGSEALGHEELDYYFIQPTIATVDSVDVHDGF